MLLLGACSSPSDGNNVTCEAGPSCVPIDAAIDAPTIDAVVPGNSAPYRIMAEPKLAASSSVRNRVIVIGTEEDGTPALDQVVLGFDRPGAGTYTKPVITLGNLGATSFFQACDASTPGCIGPLQLTAALAADPTTPVARVDVELVDPIEVNPARQCLSGGNILYLKGNDQIFTGETTISDATWTFDSAFSSFIVMRVTPAGGSDSWTLAFDVRLYAPQHIPDAYENAQRSTDTSVMERDRPALDIKGFGNQCNTITGRYDVVDFEVSGGAPLNITIAFEQHCEGSTTTVLTGCVHFQP